MVKELPLQIYFKATLFSVSQYLLLRALSGAFVVLLLVKMLVSPPHEPAQSRNILRLCSQFSDGASRDLIRNGTL